MLCGQESAYDKVLEIVISSAERARIRIRNPQTIMSDFELAIRKAAKNNFPLDDIEFVKKKKKILRNINVP